MSYKVFMSYKVLFAVVCMNFAASISAAQEEKPVEAATDAAAKAAAEAAADVATQESVSDAVAPAAPAKAADDPVTEGAAQSVAPIPQVSVPPPGPVYAVPAPAPGNCGCVSPQFVGPAYQAAPPVMYGANRGTPNFGVITNGPWYNGSTFGLFHSHVQSFQPQPRHCHHRRGKFRRAR